MDTSGPMLDVSVITPNARQRLIACLQRHALPRPIWFAARRRSSVPRIALAVGATAIFLGLLLGSSFPAGIAGAALWTVICIPLALGLAVEVRAKLLARQLPLAEGAYLFATDLVVVHEGTCRVLNLDQLQEVKLSTASPTRAGVPQFEIQFILGRTLATMAIGDRTTAQMVITNFSTSRSAFIEALNAMDWDLVATMDPLYEPRYGEELTAALKPAAPPTDGWLGFAPPAVRWGLPAALAAGCALWFLSEVMVDQSAFQRARSAGTVRAWKEYLARANPRHRIEVINHELPAAAFEVARRAGTSSALNDFLSRYGNTAVAAQAEAMLRAHFETARGNVRANTTGENREQLLQLVDWIEAHPGRSVEVRFNASSEMYLKGFDSFVEELQQIMRARGERVDVASIAPSINEKDVARREAEIISFVSMGFESLLGDVVTFRRGGAFSGRPTGFDTPTLAVLAVAEPTNHSHFDLGSGKIYLDLSFKFELTLTVPGGKERQLSFEQVPTESLPAKFSPRTLPENYSNRPLYDLMVALAYEEMQQRTAGFFFPKQMPQRTLTLPVLAATPEMPERRTGPISSATGFCISRDGYIVTAQHFTASAKSFRVKATGHPVLDADLVTQDEEHDLALLKVRGTLPPLPIRPSSEVKLGSAVATIGFPNTNIQGQEPKVGRGEVSSLAGMRDDPVLFQISVPVQPGNSGGPLLDLRGNVIGVINSRLASLGAQNVNYAVKSDYVLKLLQRANVPLSSLVASDGAAQNFEDMIAAALQATVLLEGY